MSRWRSARAPAAAFDPRRRASVESPCMDDYGLDLDEVARVIDAADVLVIRFAILDKRLLIDGRTGESEGPLIVIANEFIDALPIRQLVRRGGVWRERCITIDESGGFAFSEGDSLTALSLDAPEDAVKEAAKYEMSRPRSLRRFNTVSTKRSSARSTHWSRPGRR